MKISGSAIWCLRSRARTWSGSLTSWPATRTGTAGVSRSQIRTATGSSCPLSPGPDRARAYREVAGLFLRLRERVHIQSLQLVRVDGPHHPGREHLLEEAPDPPGTIPGRADLHERVAALRGVGGRGDHAAAGTGESGRPRSP